MSYIPHQIHLTPAQAKKLVQGGAINLPLRQMGSDKGSEVILLKPSNASKLLSSFKKSKGLRLILEPDEINETMMNGSGINIGKAFRSLGRQIKRGTKKAFREVDRAVLKPVAKGFKKEIVDSGIGKEIAKGLIDAGTQVLLPAASGALSVMMGDPTGKSGEILGSIAGQQLDKLAGKYGYGIMSEQDARKKYMSVIRSMRGKTEKEKDIIRGSGFFRTLKKVTGIGKKQFLGSARKMGRALVKNGAEAVGQAVAQYSNDPALGMALQSSLEKAGNMSVNSLQPTKGKLGIKFNAKKGLKSLKGDIEDYAAEAIDKQLDKLPPEMRNVAENALAGEIPSAADVIQEVVMPSYGFGMKRMKKGRGATQSKAFKTALKNRFGGLKLTNDVLPNQSISSVKGAQLDPRVKSNPIETPSDYGFMSPYLRQDSPAMNPFIPVSYVQEGGVSGKGLYYGKGLF